MRKLPEARDAAQGINGAGAGVRHESGHKHVSGTAQYVDDQPLPQGGLHAYVGLSNIARGRLRSMDLSAVRSAAGVVDVITSADIPGHRDIGPVFPGDPLLVEDEVQFHGQVLFAVAATSFDAARRAVRLAVVEYEELPADLDIESGLAKQSFVRLLSRPAHAIPSPAIRYP